MLYSGPFSEDVVRMAQLDTPGRGLVQRISRDRSQKRATIAFAHGETGTRMGGSLAQRTLWDWTRIARGSRATENEYQGIVRIWAMVSFAHGEAGTRSLRGLVHAIDVFVAVGPRRPDSGMGVLVMGDAG